MMLMRFKLLPRSWVSCGVSPAGAALSWRQRPGLSLVAFLKGARIQAPFVFPLVPNRMCQWLHVPPWADRQRPRWLCHRGRVPMCPQQRALLPWTEDHCGLQHMVRMPCEPAYSLGGSFSQSPLTARTDSSPPPASQLVSSPCCLSPVPSVGWC